MDQNKQDDSLREREMAENEDNNVETNVPQADPLVEEAHDADEEAHRQLEQSELTAKTIFAPDPAKLAEEERDLDEEAHRQLEQGNQDIPGQ